MVLNKLTWTKLDQEKKLVIQDGNDYKTQQRQDLHWYLKEQFRERDGSSTMPFDLDGLWALCRLAHE